MDGTGKTLLVTGSRSITDARVVDFVLSQVVPDVGATRLMHGTAAGVDTLADAWATARGMPVERVPATFGRFLERDGIMVERADVVVGIWDGHSYGTQYTMDYAAACHKLYPVVWLEAHVLEELDGNAPRST